MSAWIMSIVTLIVSVIMLELLIPNSTYQPYIRFVIGILVILVLIQPIIMLVDEGFQDRFVLEESFYIEKEELVDTSIAYISEEVEQALLKEVPEEVKNDVTDVTIITKATTWDEWLQKLESVTVHVHRHSERSKEEITDILARDWELPRELIIVQEGG
ncbi:stage III sporulation protein AF [Paenalkalicoccus suaedae]|uniref:Stage III sporulation protein AF n=1 Tax=Paenalkalicoccus suaedae TaxID=2592382 RepID=A0A859FFE4_9BACI|nr:stage III sporulation protein AF [Paenalkalicoccus suaedae]QKS70956.1 stage III sporulation protein AF [Paenalkalicoccus suaedae]